ncbi:glycosyltransferase family 4 protein [bacterium]|nr:glycosyltransferase family 4 protein [bacterium]
MRIAIDFRSTIGQPAGIGRFTNNLVKQIALLGSKNEYILYSFYPKMPNKEIKEFIKKHPNLSLKTNPVPGRIMRYLWDYFKIPIEFSIGEVDIIHIMDFLIPNIKKARLIVTVHDISSILFPQWHTRYTRRWVKDRIYLAKEKAHKIIVDSVHTKKDLVRTLGVSEDLIAVIYGGVGEQFQPIKDRETLKQIKKRYKIRDKYLLFLGTLEPRKNILGLIRAFHKIKNRFPNYQLVIAGKRGWKFQEIFKTVGELRLEDKVIFTGYLPEEDIPSLYSGAELFIYPTLYEGFGFPPLEAMACGTPVITSNLSSLPEVMGEAGILIDPNNIDELARAIESALSNEDLKRELRAKGVRQAAKFSWKRCAQETIKVYQEVYNR